MVHTLSVKAMAPETPRSTLKNKPYNGQRRGAENAPSNICTKEQGKATGSTET